MEERNEPLATEEDVDEVLKLALRLDGQGDRVLRERLEAAADELGISRESLAAAEEQYAVEKQEKREFLEFRSRQVREFREHFFAYIIINSLLVAINFISDGTVSWAIWPILGWGVGLAFHAWGSLNPGSDSFQGEFQSFRRRRARTQPPPRPPTHRTDKD